MEKFKDIVAYIIIGIVALAIVYGACAFLVVSWPTGLVVVGIFAGGWAVTWALNRAFRIQI